jgi:hypothetical protein
MKEMTVRRREVLKARHEALKAKTASRFAMAKCLRFFEDVVFTPSTPTK